MSRLRGISIVLLYLALGALFSRARAKNTVGESNDGSERLQRKRTSNGLHHRRLTEGDGLDQELALKSTFYTPSKAQAELDEIDILQELVQMNYEFNRKLSMSMSMSMTLAPTPVPKFEMSFESTVAIETGTVNGADTLVGDPTSSPFLQSLNDEVETVTCIDSNDYSTTTCETTTIYPVGQTRRRIRILQSQRSLQVNSELIIAFETLLQVICGTSTCLDAEALSSQIYSEATGALQSGLQDGTFISAVKADSSQEIQNILDASTVSAAFGNVIVPILSRYPSVVPSLSPSIRPSGKPSASPSGKPVWSSPNWNGWNVPSKRPVNEWNGHDNWGSWGNGWGGPKPTPKPSPAPVDNSWSGTGPSYWVLNGWNQDEFSDGAWTGDGWSGAT